MPDADARSPEAIATSEAVQLFVDRASAASSGFALTADNAAAVAEICRRLDGLPLALELAAARLRTLGPTALAERLRQHSNLLGASQRGADGRHRTLRDTLEWSYGLLTRSEQQLFALARHVRRRFRPPRRRARLLRAGRHRATWPTCSPTSSTSPWCSSSTSNEPRYRMLETLREFGLERLAQRRERADLRARHVAWYVRVAREEAAGLGGRDEAACAAQLDRDFDNCREAHASAVLIGDTESAVTLVASLREFAFRRMRYEVTAWAEVTRAMPGAEQHPRLPVVIAVAAYGAFVRGDLDAAIRLAEEAVAAADRLGTDSSGLAERALGNAVFYEGDIKTALEWMDRMVESARAHGIGRRVSRTRCTCARSRRRASATPNSAPRSPRRRTVLMQSAKDPSTGPKRRLIAKGGTEPAVRISMTG